MSAKVLEWFDIGEIYYKRGKFAKAIKAYSNAIYLNPNHAKAYLSRSSAYDIIGQHDKAIEDLEKAIKINNQILIKSKGSQKTG